SQRNTTDPSAVVSESPAPDYDSANESSVCSTPLLRLKKLDGAEPGFVPKTVKSILKLKSTFKAKTLNGITLNEPSSAPAKGNKSSSASKTNSAHAGKLKNLNVEDDPPLAIVIKELNELKLQIMKKKSSYSKTKTLNRTCDHAEFMSSIHTNQHHTGQGLFLKEKELILEIFNMSQKNYETCGSNVHTTSVHNDIEWFRKKEIPHAKKVESSNALRSKTPTK
nr:hypothetical protein [Tanacetum cinerariifolium]